MKMNLPNKLTVSRLVFVIIFIILASIPETFKNHLIYWRIGYIVVVIAALTDILDGYLARKLNLVTDFGKLMDPLADKVLVLGAYIVFTGFGLVPAWATVLILAREFAVTGLRILAVQRGIVISAKEIGKLKTFLQLAILAYGGCFWVEWIEKTPLLYGIIWPVILYSMVALTIYSGYDYFKAGRDLYKNNM